MTIDEARTIKDNPADYSILRLVEALKTAFTELDKAEAHTLDRERIRILDMVRGLA